MHVKIALSTRLVRQLLTGATLTCSMVIIIIIMFATTILTSKIFTLGSDPKAWNWSAKLLEIISSNYDDLISSFMAFLVYLLMLWTGSSHVKKIYKHGKLSQYGHVNTCVCPVHLQLLIDLVNGVEFHSSYQLFIL